MCLVIALHEVIQTFAEVTLADQTPQHVGAMVTVSRSVKRFLAEEMSVLSLIVNGQRSTGATLFLLNSRTAARRRGRVCCDRSTSGGHFRRLNKMRPVEWSNEYGTTSRQPLVESDKQTGYLPC